MTQSSQQHTQGKNDGKNAKIFEDFLTLISGGMSKFSMAELHKLANDVTKPYIDKCGQGLT
jgi:hypothetical protein